MVLASEELASTVVKCAIHTTEHGSGHRAIETTFDIATPKRAPEQRLLLKNAPWTAIKARITTALCFVLVGGRVQQQTDRLMTAVLEAVYALTPKAGDSQICDIYRTTRYRHRAVNQYPTVTIFIKPPFTPDSSGERSLRKVP